MASKKFHRSLPIPSLSGEHIKFERQLVPNADGTTTVRLGFDLNRAPVPTRSYTAGVVGLHHEFETVRLLFGQTHLFAGGLRNLVIIEMSQESAIQCFENSRSFISRARQYVDSKSGTVPPLFQVSDAGVETVTLRANVLACYQAGSETDLDFYYISPRGIVFVNTSGANDLPIEPVVRISLDIRLVVAILEGLGEQLQAQRENA